MTRRPRDTRLLNPVELQRIATMYNGVYIERTNGTDPNVGGEHMNLSMFSGHLFNGLCHRTSETTVYTNAFGC